MKSFLFFLLISFLSIYSQESKSLVVNLPDDHSENKIQLSEKNDSELKFFDRIKNKNSFLSTFSFYDNFISLIDE